MLRLEPEVLGIERDRASHVLYLITNPMEALDMGVSADLDGLCCLGHVDLSFCAAFEPTAGLGSIGCTRITHVCVDGPFSRFRCPTTAMAWSSRYETTLELEGCGFTSAQESRARWQVARQGCST